MAEVIKCGTVNQKFLPCMTNIDEIKDMDWCGYILDCLKRTKSERKRGTHYNGPLVFLVLFYAQTVMGSKHSEDDLFIPVINMWSSDDLLELENQETRDVATKGLNEVIERDYTIGNSEDDDMTLNQLWQHSSKVKYTKRKSAIDDDNLQKKAKNVDYEVSNNKDMGNERNEADTSNPYSTQNLIEDLSTPNVQIGFEGLYSVFEGGAVSYGRAQQPKSAKEYKNVVKVNMSMISDISVETHDMIDQAIKDYPEDEEFPMFKAAMHKKFNAEAVECNEMETDKKGGQNEEGNDVVNEMDTQFFDSPTVMKSIVSIERSYYESVRMKSAFSMDIDKNTRRLSFEGPNFDLGITQMILEATGPDSDRTIIDDEPVVETDKVHIASAISGKVKPFVNGTRISKLRLNRKNDCIDCEGVVQKVFDAVPLSSVKPEIKRRSCKRETKPTYIMLSPYVKRSVCVDGNVSVVEKRIANSIFAARLPEEDIIFKTHSVECQRGIMESMMPGITMVSGAIDVWCLVLNYEERVRNPDKVSRLFCNTSMVTQDMLIGDDVFDKMYHIFFENMSNVLSSSVFKSIDDIDPVMFKWNLIFVCFATDRYGLI